MTFISLPEVLKNRNFFASIFHMKWFIGIKKILIQATTQKRIKCDTYKPLELCILLCFSLRVGGKFCEHEFEFCTCIMDNKSSQICCIERNKWFSPFTTGFSPTFVSSMLPTLWGGSLCRTFSFHRRQGGSVVEAHEAYPWSGSWPSILLLRGLEQAT